MKLKLFQRSFSLLTTFYEKVIDLDSQDQILSTNVFNPGNVSPMELYSGGYCADKKVVQEGVELFKSKKELLPICKKGNPFELSLKSKVTLIDLFMATGNSIKSVDKAEEYLEDIRFADPSLRTMSQLRYGFFFAMDYDWDTEKCFKFCCQKMVSIGGRI